MLFTDISKKYLALKFTDFLVIVYTLGNIPLYKVKYVIQPKRWLCD